MKCYKIDAPPLKLILYSQDGDGEVSQKELFGSSVICVYFNGVFVFGF